MSLFRNCETAEPFAPIADELVLFLEYYSTHADPERLRWRTYPFDQEFFERSEVVDRNSFQQRINKILELAETFDKLIAIVFMSGHITDRETVYDAFDDLGEPPELFIEDRSEQTERAFFDLGCLWGQYLALYGQAYPDERDQPAIGFEGVSSQGIMVSQLVRSERQRAFQADGAKSQRIIGKRSSASIQKFIEQNYPGGTDGRTNKAVAAALLKQVERYVDLVGKSRIASLNREEIQALEDLRYLDGLVKKGENPRPYSFGTIRTKLSQILAK